jgi:hypothetical protein
MRRLIVMIMGVIFLSSPLLAEEEESLIINPKLKGGLGSLPFVGDTRPVRVDTMPPGWKPQKVTKVNYGDYIPPNAPPSDLLITGMVPDGTRRYVVAVTKDEAEFQRAFPEYKRLIAEGKYREAGQVLLVCSSIGVSTKVESFWGGKKTRDMPEKVGSFFFEFSLLAFQDRGGCLTFLSYEPKPGDDVVDFGYGLSDTIHGVLMIEQQPTKEGERPKYTMKIIKAKVTQ